MRRLLPVPLLLLLAVAACGATPAVSPSAQASPAASPTRLLPTFPELTGDLTTTAKLLSFDPANKAAVVEPIIFQTGPDYCKALHISPVEARCSQEVVIDASNTRVTLPMATKLDMRDIGDGSCAGTMTGGSTCKSTTGYMARLAGDDAAVSITLQAGTLVRIAELYQP
ncbi:hypothetical protein [Winogradskya humida]|uniref:Uncharacterized protein n=1 Tax=Winogradskya humida TaxID=113566 RepID=A0ABQ3ZK36_9ACTN|nr:hypothetical protein [Actinoplanes humidus]GIE18917.1 hypothetical protein Ahu01nite_020190 [Actinoplanes humidus]